MVLPKILVLTLVRAQVHCNGSFAPSKHTLPNVTEPLAIAAIPAMDNDQGHSAGPWQREGVVVADGGDSTLKVFYPKPNSRGDGEMEMVQQIGEPGGHGGPDPTVRDGRFFWGSWNVRDGRDRQDGWIKHRTSIAVDDWGAVSDPPCNVRREAG